MEDGSKLCLGMYLRRDSKLIPGVSRCTEETPDSIGTQTSNLNTRGMMQRVQCVEDEQRLRHDAITSTQMLKSNVACLGHFNGTQYSGQWK